MRLWFVAALVCAAVVSFVAPEQAAAQRNARIEVSDADWNMVDGATLRRALLQSITPEEMIRLAERGDERMGALAGAALYVGEAPFVKDEARGLELLRRAARRDDRARSTYAYYLRMAANNDAAQIARAVTEANEVADSRNPMSRVNSGLMLVDPRFGPPNYEAALPHFQFAAAAGQRTAEYHLARYYEMGLAGIARDTTESTRLFRLSSDDGFAPAQYWVGRIYQNGWYGQQRNREEAARLYALAAEQQSNEAAVALGTMLLLRELGDGRQAEAVPLFEAAAARGSADATFRLGQMRREGIGGLPRDEAEGLRLIRAGVEGNSADAQYFLGRLHMSGAGVEQSQAEALRLFMLAAQQGQQDAQVWVGLMKSSGVDVPASDQQVLSWLRAGVDRGSVDATLALAGLNLDGRAGLQVNRAEAIRLYRIAADAGNRRAQAMAGHLLMRDGPTQNDAEAVRYLRLAAEAGDVESVSRLASMTFSGRGGLARNEREGVRLHRQAAAQGSIASRESLALMLRVPEYAPLLNAPEIAGWARESAEAGEKELQFEYGMMLMFGDGVARNYAEAMRWFREASREGHGEASYRISQLYGEGRGVAQDHRAEIDWLRTAILQNDSSSMMILARYFDEGTAILRRNTSESARLWLQAANAGEKLAANIVALRYEFGQDGMPRNRTEAIRWYRVAVQSSSAETTRLAREGLTRLGVR